MNLQEIPAVLMRGGTSKGVFLLESDLPKGSIYPDPALDSLLQKLMGSPDPYGKQMDGMGGGTSSTSKVAIIRKSTLKDHDVDYLFGQVSIDQPLVDWSGNCGNLTAAVCYFAVYKGLIDSKKLINSKLVKVRVWQRNINKSIEISVPVENGKPLAHGEFQLDGVTFPSTKIIVDFLNPVDGGEMLFPTGNMSEFINVADMGQIEVSLVNAGIPTVFVDAKNLGLSGKESQQALNQQDLLNRLELIRAQGALKMGVIAKLEDALQKQHSPKIVLVSRPAEYHASSGQIVAKEKIDLLARAISMGKPHHAIMATAAVATCVAANVKGTLVNRFCDSKSENAIRLGHASGVMGLSAEVVENSGCFIVKKVTMERSARLLMDGKVFA